MITKKDPTKIHAYSLHIVWNNGKKEALTTLPPYVINSIENYLDALEEEFKGSEVSTSKRKSLKTHLCKPNFYKFTKIN